MDKFHYNHQGYDVLLYEDTKRFSLSGRSRSVLVLQASIQKEDYFRAVFAYKDFMGYSVGDLLGFSLDGQDVRDVYDSNFRLRLKLRMKEVGFLHTIFHGTKGTERDELFRARHCILHRFGGPILEDLCDD